MKKYFLISFLALFSVALSEAKLKVITTTQDLEYLTQRVGGEFVTVESLSSGDQDLHMVEPRPSMVMKLKKADMFIRTGLDIDMWADGLIAAARNSKITFAQPGYVDTSVGIYLLQAPTDKVDGSMGDIHIFGNPHYWLDPANSKIMAKNILDGLCKVFPEKSDFFRKNYESYISELDTRLSKWQEKMGRLSGTKIVTYHNSWVYFAKRFNLEIVGNIEPKPGIPPTPSHLERLIGTMKKENTHIIMAETFFSQKGTKMISEKTGASVIIVPSSVGGLPEVKDYFGLFDSITEKLIDAAEKK